MIPRQKISSVSRWLINIGLTLQFYIPWAFLLCSYLIAFIFITVPSSAEFIKLLTTAAKCFEVALAAIVFLALSGGAIATPIILLVILAVPTVWCAIYLLWDRHGNRFNALCFLIATDILVGGGWFLLWKNEFGQSWNDPGVWLFSPVPIIIPTLLYIVALLLWTPENAS